MNEELRARTGQLDEVAEYLESILASLPGGLVVLDAGLRVRSWNSRAEALWGLRGDEVSGQPFFALEFGLPITQLRELVRDGLAGTASPRVDIDAVNRLGRPFTCTVTVTPLGAGGGGVLVSMEER